MTTTAHPAPDTAAPIDAAEPLRRVVRLDVVACAASGTLLLAATGPVADLLGIDNGAPVAAAGAFLLVLAAGLGWLVRSSTEALLRLTPWSAAGDVAWAVGSVAVAVAAPLDGAGRALVLVQAVGVAAMAVAKMVARRRVVAR